MKYFFSILFRSKGKWAFLSTLDRNSKPTDKLAPLKYGPYEVIEVMDNEKYIVKQIFLKN